MTRTARRSRGHRDRETEQAFGLVADTLEDAVRETLADRSHAPGRLAVERLTSADDEFVAVGEAPPGWTLTFLTLAEWLDAARSALSERPERDEEALAWIEANLGRRYRSRCRFTIGALQDPERADEIAPYVEALGEDFLPTLVWIVAAVVELYGDGEPGWPRRLLEQAEHRD